MEFKKGDVFMGIVIFCVFFGIYGVTCSILKLHNFWEDSVIKVIRELFGDKFTDILNFVVGISLIYYGVSYYLHHFTIN